MEVRNDKRTQQEVAWWLWWSWGKCGTGQFDLTQPVPVSWLDLAQTSVTVLALLTSPQFLPCWGASWLWGRGAASALTAHTAFRLHCWWGRTHRSGSKQAENEEEDELRSYLTSAPTCSSELLGWPDGQLSAVLPTYRARERAEI